MLGMRIPLFRLFGFEIRLDISWVLIAVLITWTLAASVFPAFYPDLAPGTYWSMGVIAAAGLFASIVLHETAHAAVARHYGLPIDGITLFIFGGVAEMRAEPEQPKVEFLVAIAGPIASLVIALLCFAIAALAGGLGAATAFTGVFSYLALINGVLVAFNMVPAFPLDGGRMLRAALWAWQGSLRKATRISAGIGSGFGIALVVLGVLSVLTGNFIGGMWWFLIGLFVRSAAQMSYQQVLVRQGLRGVTVARIMCADPVTVPPTISVADLVENVVYRHHFKMYPVVEDGRALGCVALRDIKEVPREAWPRTPVQAIMRPCSAETTVPPGADALEVLGRMHQSGNGRLLVTDGERLVGIVTLKDMLKFLSVKLDLEAPDEDARLIGAGLGIDRLSLRRDR